MPRFIFRGMIWLAALAPAAAFAQPEGTAPPSNFESTGGPSYWIDGAIVVVLAAAALFAVCRSSRRQ